MDQNDVQKYLGKGWSFPLHLNPQGRMALSTGADDINQSLRIILETLPGERKMRPDFGCRAKELIFMPMDLTTKTMMEEYVRTALTRWEPRIDIHEISAITDDNIHGAWFINIKYKIKATHDERSIVHPFYIEDEEPAI